MRFAYPVYLLSLLIIPYLIWRYRQYRDSAPIRYSDISRVKKIFNVQQVAHPGHIGFVICSFSPDY